MLQIKTLDSFQHVIEHVGKTYPFFIETRGMRKKLCANGKELASYRPGIANKTLQNKKARQLMRMVRAAVTRYIKKVELQVPEIKKEYPVVFTNKLFWQSIPDNTQFYIIDAKHAYWRIAFINGYIGKKLYENYADDKDMKTVRNISMAVLSSSHKREYYENNKKILEVDCDISLYSRIYNNIRYTSYNLCGMIRNRLDDACFAYRTDGVFILKPGLARAKKIFEVNDMPYKIDKCVKIDNKTYVNSDGELKKFA